ncbi:hypothetical protein Dsin_032423 [Dipteronia sinensis]|uniref:RNase H type-1 domain-containing protein n=1 Tax=Dipteronia sinensis TaxID=43782 RepID=A0AAD9ZNL1_9ROSI|nr:hypothetical protein Dsin_032423 [Dipteronia sinensis]
MFHSIASQVSQDVFSLFCMVSWAIWVDHNSLSNCGKASTPGMVVSKVIILLEEFQSSRLAFSPRASPPAIKDSVDWLAPPPVLLKLNIGTTLCKDSGSIGIRVSIRDDKGRVLVARSKLLYGFFNGDIGKFMALRDGLMLAKFYNLPVRFVEVNSCKVFFSLNSQVSPLGDARFIINDIKALLSDVGSCKCLFVPKPKNVLAQNLTSLAFSSVRERIWLDLMPSLVL